MPPKEKGGGVGVGGVGRLKRKGGGRGRKESKEEDREGQPTPAFQPASRARGERPAHSRSLTFPRSLRPRRLQTPRRDLGVFHRRATAAAAAGKRQARSHPVPLGVTPASYETSWVT